MEIDFVIYLNQEHDGVKIENHFKDNIILITLLYLTIAVKTVGYSNVKILHPLLSMVVARNKKTDGLFLKNIKLYSLI